MTRDKLDRWQCVRTAGAPKGFWSQLTQRELRTWTRTQVGQFFLSHREDRRAFRNYVRELCATNNNGG